MFRSLPIIGFWGGMFLEIG